MTDHDLIILGGGQAATRPGSMEPPADRCTAEPQETCDER
jgi:hypothetical protein